jgi:putative protease
MQQEPTQLPELLAPAGSMDSLVAAVNAGADAVYLGGKRFGARNYSPNFTGEELGRAIDYAHLRGARVYVTVNTLVHDRELPDVARYLLDLYAMGADAVLIQDSGVALLARDVVPDLPRHASTQCTVTSPEGVVYAKRSGYDRVVLAREVPPGEIDRIFLVPPEKRPGIEIFIHGALCYAYSGQCLLSSVIGGRSGNRGACAQPCRRDYSLVAGLADSCGRIAGPRVVPLKERCLLSTKDLCLYPHLPLVLQRPFSALKIEGRMRSPDYVAVVVSIYRRALDAVANGSFVPQQSEMDDLAIAFSRGFTSGYLCGESGPARMGRDRPDNRGLFIGTIRACQGQTIRVTAVGAAVPAPGDGLVGIDPVTLTEAGFVIRSIPEQAGSDLIIRQSTGCRPGMALYLTRSAALERSAAAIRNAPGPAGRFPVPVDISLTVGSGHPPVLAGAFTLPGGDTVPVRVEADFIPERAEGRPTTSEEITRQIVKTGRTAFRVRDLAFLYDGGLFLPVGQLNQFRRQFFDEAEKTLLARYLPGNEMREAADCRLGSLLQVLVRPGNRQARIPELAVFCNEIDAVTAARRAGCGRIYLEPDPEHMEEDLLQAITGCREQNVRFAWKWPRVQAPEFTNIALPLLPGLEAAGLEEVMTEGAMYTDPIHSIVPGIRVTGGPDLNIFNACAVRALYPDCSGFTLSPELSGDDIADLCSRLEEKGMVSIIVQGSIPAMITEDTLLDLVQRQRDPAKVLYGLSDITGRIFPVHPDPWGRTHILNAAELCLIDYLPALAGAGVDACIIDARWRGPSYASEMISVYQEAMDDRTWMEGTGNPSRLIPDLKARIKAMAQGGITAGHYLRGLSSE